MARVQKFNQEKFFKKSALPKKEVPIAYFICDRRRSLRRVNLRQSRRLGRQSRFHDCRRQSRASSV